VRARAARTAPPILDAVGSVELPRRDLLGHGLARDRRSGRPARSSTSFRRR
jgi:hypothetical protein